MTEAGSMVKPWYRRLFSATPLPPDFTAPQALAAGGDAAAQFYLGVHYSCGGEPTRDLAQALRWYRLAAEQNHALAQFNLGMMLAQGQGTEPDAAAGRAWIERAAVGGDAGAQFHCGNHCHRELLRERKADVPELRIEAYKWFQLAAAQGYRDSVSSRDRITTGMSHAEVTEANERVSRFAPADAAA
jgi:TPR repeat protein